MKQVTLINEYGDSLWTSREEFSLLKRRKTGEYEILLFFSSCRSWMCDSLFYMKNKGYKYKPTYPIVFNYKSGPIYIGIKFESLKIKEVFLNNIPSLHLIEDQAGVIKSKVFETDNSLICVVKGSKYWKDSCWKMMLYTFYLKTFCYADPKKVDIDYWKHLTKNNNEDILLSKIKTHDEIFDKSVYGAHNDRGMHNLEGFVSICSGKNEPMAKYLGVDSK